LHLDFFEGLPLCISLPNASQLTDIGLFLDGYGGFYLKKDGAQRQPQIFNLQSSIFNSNWSE